MTIADPPRTKPELRTHFRTERRSIPEAARLDYDHRIRSHLASALAGRQLRRIAAFLAFDGEPDLEPQLRAWHAAGLGVALPVVPPRGQGDLTMRAWSPDGDMDRNVLGILEPGIGPEIKLAGLDLVLMPLVAFDAAGNRLGMGAGYYDRYLAAGPAAGPPLRVGVAYACQQASSLPRDEWDVPLHAVVTEQGWLSCP